MVPDKIPESKWQLHVVVKLTLNKPWMFRDRVWTNTLRYIWLNLRKFNSIFVIFPYFLSKIYRYAHTHVLKEKEGLPV